ncbi:MAG: diacylglycerol kinase family protein, partial [Eggerthellaceae bacterium]|nr:diacylglycerol kinase family protein [Eggerthellaceae bacterium]
MRNEDDKRDGARFTYGQAFRCAFAGLAATLRTQRNAKVHLVAALLAIVLGIVLRIGLGEWCAI